MQYQRCHKEAALCLTAAVEGGAVAPPPPEPRRASPPLARAATIAGTPGGASTIGGNPAEGRNPASDAAVTPSTPNPLRRRAMSATLDKVREAMPSASNKKDLVQWFLPSEQHRKEALIESAQVAADAAEEARRVCRVSWDALRSCIHSAVQVIWLFVFGGRGGEGVEAVAACMPWSYV